MSRCVAMQTMQAWICGARREPLYRQEGAAVIDLLVRTEIPRGYFGKLESKSGLNVKHGVASLGGTIDSGFTGTIVAKLYNFGPEDYVLEAGDKCVQLIIMPCETPELVKVDNLHDTERGSNGFGSTGR